MFTAELHQETINEGKEKIRKHLPNCTEEQLEWVVKQFFWWYKSGAEDVLTKILPEAVLRQMKPKKETIN